MMLLFWKIAEGEHLMSIFRRIDCRHAGGFSEQRGEVWAVASGVEWKSPHEM